MLFIELLALGQHNRVNMNPSDTFRMAIYKMATKVILVHNHPSGSIAVSEEDKSVTDYLYKAGKFLKIDVIDHLVISEKKFHSFEDSGLMDKFRTSGTWEIVDKTKADLTEMRTQIIADKATKKTAIEIAKKMLIKGTPAELVKEYTGLTLRDINKILKEIG
ncbi:MAG: DNA repair protein [Fluviicola sp.]|nr:DNA repair protein [Fluviicola sp.]